MQVLIQRGQIWWAQIPFNEDPDKQKARPVVVIGYSSFAAGEDHAILVVPSFTFGGDPSKARVGDVKLADPPAGMEASFIRTRRLMSLHPQQVQWDRGTLGSVTQKDWEGLMTEVEKLFAAPQVAKVPGATTR